MNTLSAFHAIEETMRAHPRECILHVASGSRALGPRARRIVEEARRLGVRIHEVQPEALEHMSPGQKGVVLEMPRDVVPTRSLDDLCQPEITEGLVLVLDHIEDPQNLGAILRSADAFGADAVIIPSRRAAPLTEAVERASAGAVAWIPVVQTGNLAQAVDQLKNAGWWVYATDMDGKPLADTTLSRKAVIILGNEGKGVGRLLQTMADETIAIPMRGHVDSLNVSVTAGILLYEFRRTSPH